MIAPRIGQRMSLILLSSFVFVGLIPEALAQPPPGTIFRPSDVAVTATNNIGSAADDWTVFYEDPGDIPEVESVYISPPAYQKGFVTGGTMMWGDPPDTDAYMLVPFTPQLPNGQTLTFHYNMPDSDWDMVGWDYSDVRIGPGNSMHPLATEEWQQILLTLDNSMRTHDLDLYGGSGSPTGRIIINDIGYRFSSADLALEDLSFAGLNDLGLTAIPGTHTLDLGEEVTLPALTRPAETAYLQFAYRVAWEGATDDQSLMAVQLHVPEPATLLLLALGATAAIGRRRP